MGEEKKVMIIRKKKNQVVWVCDSWVRTEALLRREVSLILSSSGELLKTIPTRGPFLRVAQPLFFFFFSIFFPIHSEFYWSTICICFWLSRNSLIRRLVFVSEIMGEVNNSCCFQQRMASMLFSSSFFFFDFFGYWPNTLRRRRRVAWEWARATKKVRGYVTFL